MICEICPKKCQLNTCETGFCKIRRDIGLAENYGKCSTVIVDAIEKRPFFHVTPGEKYLSVGLFGCNLSCDFCLNFDISKEFNNSKSTYYSPENLVQLCKEKQAKGIIFTYTEPVIHYEYLIDVATVDKNLIFGLKTNGFATSDVIKKLLELYAIFNVDIKGNDDFYINSCRASLDIVKSNVSLLVHNDKWVEISYLINPKNVNDLKFHKSIAKWLCDLNKDIPVHLLNFYPYHKMKEEYPISCVKTVYDIFKEHLYNTYVSNVYDEEYMKMRNTYCSICGNEMINRGKYIGVSKLECCGQKLAGFFAI